MKDTFGCGLREEEGKKKKKSGSDKKEVKKSVCETYTEKKR